MPGARPTTLVLVLTATLAALSLLTITPATARAGDDLFGRDKALHFAASAGIALGGYGATALFTPQRAPRWLVGGGLALFAGIAKEISDRYTGGDPSWRDLGWDVVGTAAGVTFSYALDWGISRLWPAPHPVSTTGRF